MNDEVAAGGPAHEPSYVWVWVAAALTVILTNVVDKCHVDTAGMTIFITGGIISAGLWWRCRHIAATEPERVTFRVLSAGTAFSGGATGVLRADEAKISAWLADAVCHMLHSGPPDETLGELAGHGARTAAPPPASPLPFPARTDSDVLDLVRNRDARRRVVSCQAAGHGNETTEGS